MMKPLPVLYVSWMGEWGGAEIALARLVKSLDRRKFQPHAWIFKFGPLVDFMRAQSVPTRLFPALRLFQLLLNPFFHCRFSNFLKSQKIELVHANGTLAYLAAYFPCRLAGVPLIWWLVDLPQGSDKAENLAARTASAMIVCNSRATAQAFSAVYPKNKSPRKVVYPAIEIPVKNWGEEKKAVLRELAIPEDGMVVLSASRMQKWKGQEVLMRAIPEVLKKTPNVFFVFAGGTLPGMEDGTEESLKLMAANLRIQDHCRFLGFRADIEAFMAAADIVVHTSLQPEPFGLVVAEAMAYKKAVIASNRGGPLEIIDSGSEGLLIEPGDPGILAAAIVELARNPAARAALGEKGFEKISAAFHPAKLTAQMESLYENLLEGKR